MVVCAGHLGEEQTVFASINKICGGFCRCKWGIHEAFCVFNEICSVLFALLDVCFFWLCAVIGRACVDRLVPFVVVTGKTTTV